MDRLDEQAEISRQLKQLQEEHRKAMEANDLATVNELQQKINDLMDRRKRSLDS